MTRSRLSGGLKLKEMDAVVATQTELIVQVPVTIQGVWIISRQCENNEVVRFCDENKKTMRSVSPVAGRNDGIICLNWARHGGDLQAHGKQATAGASEDSWGG